MSEELKEYLISQFKQRETDLLLNAITEKSKARHIIQAFFTDDMDFVTVTFDKKLNKFIDLYTDVSGNKKAKFETIDL